MQSARWYIAVVAQTCREMASQHHRELELSLPSINMTPDPPDHELCTGTRCKPMGDYKSWCFIVIQCCSAPHTGKHGPACRHKPTRQLQRPHSDSMSTHTQEHILPLSVNRMAERLLHNAHLTCQPGYKDHQCYCTCPVY